MQPPEPERLPGQCRRSWIIRWTVLALLILLLIGGSAGVGTWGLHYLRERRLRRIQEEPPIEVVVTYPSASAEIVEDTVIAALEQQLSGTTGVRRIESDSTFGVGKVRLYVDPDDDREVLTVLIRNRVALAQPIFPTGVGPPTIGTGSLENEPALWVFLSGGESLEKVAEAAEKEVQPRLSALPGVSGIQFGRQKPGEPLLGPSIYININRDKLARLGVFMNDFNKWLEGKLKGKSANTIEQLQNEVFTTASGKTVRLKDVAEVKENVTIGCRTRIDGKAVIAIGLRVTPDTKPEDLIEAIKEAFPEIRPHLPVGVQMQVMLGAGKQ